MLVKHPKWKNYKADKQGNIYGPTDTKLKPAVHTTGYFIFTVRKPGIQKQLRAHKFIWEVFKGSVPKGKVVNHKNGNKLDNRLANLNLMSIKDNTRHAAKLGKLGRKS